MEKSDLTRGREREGERGDIKQRPCFGRDSHVKVSAILFNIPGRQFRLCNSSARARFSSIHFTTTYPRLLITEGRCHGMMTRVSRGNWLKVSGVKGEEEEEGGRGVGGEHGRAFP